MTLLVRADFGVAATLALSNEILLWQGSDLGKRASLDKLLLDVAIFRTLARSAVQVPLTGTTVETALATVSVPANAMGANGILRITPLVSNNNSAGTKTTRVRFGGLAGTIYQSSAATTTLSTRLQCQIHNRNATNSQVGASTAITGFGVAAGAPVTSALDTTAAQDIVISGQLSNGADNMALEAYLIEILKAA